ncbi:RNA polymerase sigma factor [Aliirhizobium terrae]|uniref:RNA polymerase sigma factor n=1 Tax=Terrirhizobium terrae TaxID=2926709 RepID=UPI002575DAD5|nr:RNA polymerase sigma factor [Rhizobium sp. CC-CFT758]WJH40428.1 RNA polymerase sigma factor [Rhizobium sp. CC-CFT758]
MTASATSNDIRRDLVALLPQLRRFALTLTSDASMADALVQDVCAHAIQKSHHWKGKGRIESWLFSLIRTTWSDQAKKRGDQEANSVNASSNDIQGIAGRTLLCLPEGLASTLLLADVERFDYAEAASILGIPSDTFASRLCAARLHLASLPPEPMERRA